MSEGQKCARQQTPFGAVLTLACNDSSGPKVKISAWTLARLMLEETGLFVGCTSELHVWTAHLQPHTMPIVQAAVSMVAGQPHYYLNVVNSLMQSRRDHIAAEAQTFLTFSPLLVAAISVVFSNANVGNAAHHEGLSSALPRAYLAAVILDVFYSQTSQSGHVSTSKSIGSGSPKMRRSTGQWRDKTVDSNSNNTRLKEAS